MHFTPIPQLTTQKNVSQNHPQKAKPFWLRQYTIKLSLAGGGRYSHTSTGLKPMAAFPSVTPSNRSVFSIFIWLAWLLHGYCAFCSVLVRAAYPFAPPYFFSAPTGLISFIIAQISALYSAAILSSVMSHKSCFRIESCSSGSGICTSWLHRFT